MATPTRSGKRIIFQEDVSDPDIWSAFNQENILLGSLRYERVGQWMHWCWYQEEEIRMSPGCLQEVRDKQKELLKLKSKKNEVK